MLNIELFIRPCQLNKTKDQKLRFQIHLYSVATSRAALCFAISVSDSVHPARLSCRSKTRHVMCLQACSRKEGCYEALSNVVELHRRYITFSFANVEHSRLERRLSLPNNEQVKVLHTGHQLVGHLRRRPGKLLLQQAQARS